MIDCSIIDIVNALPSRRSFVGSIGLLLAALPAWIAYAPSTQDIIVVEGWILADTDFR
jgi:hypothetical protein